MRIRKILFPTDFSDANRGALRWASALARQNGAELLIVHAFVPPIPPAHLAGTAAAFAESAAVEQQKLLHGVRPVDSSIQHEHRLLDGSPRDAILSVAHDEQADLIVIGTHGRGGVSHLLMGSVAEAVVRHAPCPVITVKSVAGAEQDAAGDTTQSVRKILVPTDLSPRANSAIDIASSLAKDFDAELVLLHVEHTALGYGGGEIDYSMLIPSVEEIKAQLIQIAPPDAEVRCSRHVLTGHPAATINAFANEYGVDLIVMTTHGRTGVLRMLMGSVAEAVVRNASCPVLTAKTAAMLEPAAALHHR